MEIEKLIDVDYRTPDGKKAIDGALKRLKPLAKFDGEIPMEALEKAVRSLSVKFGLVPQWISLDPFVSNTTIVYSCSILTKGDRKWLGTVYGSTLRELFSKLVLKIVLEAKKSKGKKNAAR